MRSATLKLVIDMPGGEMVREIEPALPLRSDADAGTAAEDATHNAAALWGLPDFVYRANIRRVGSGSREVGDRLLLVGGQGVVIQVKSRATPTDDEHRERRWAVKQTSAALGQARGTIRTLEGHPTTAKNGRGDEIEIRPGEVRWLAVVVLDHPAPPAGVLPSNEAFPAGACVLLRRDWEFLWEQLKSAHAVVGYLSRTADDPVELGEEPVRYFQLALADKEAAPAPVNPALLGATGRRASAPLLPLLPSASDDRQGHLILRSIFEDIATFGIAQHSRLRVLSELDRLPVSQRGDVGRALISGLQLVSGTPAGITEWRLRRVVGTVEGPLTVHLGFGVCSQCSEMHQDCFRAWVELRHHETQQITDDIAELTSVGVLLTPRRDGERPWDTTVVAVAGDLELDANTLQAYQAIWKGFDEASAEHAPGEL